MGENEIDSELKMLAEHWGKLFSDEELLFLDSEVDRWNKVVELSNTSCAKGIVYNPANVIIIKLLAIKALEINNSIREHGKVPIELYKEYEEIHGELEYWDE